MVETQSPLAHNSQEAIDSRIAHMLGCRVASEVERQRLFERFAAATGSTCDLLDACFLDSGSRAASAVGKVVVQSGGHITGLATGFLVAPRLLLTSALVLPSRDAAAASRVEFEGDAIQRNPMAFELQPDLFFLSSPPLDFDIALVAVKPQSIVGNVPLSRFGTIPLNGKSGEILGGEPVTLIQYAAGGLKQIALRTNRVMFAPSSTDQYLHYRTEGASVASGAPVFNDQWEVIAIHHSGSPKVDETGHWMTIDGQVWRPELGEDRIHWLVGEGIRAAKILAFLEAAPGLTPEQAILRDEVLHPPAPTPVIAERKAVGNTPTNTEAAPSSALLRVSSAAAHVHAASVGSAVLRTVPIRVSITLDSSDPALAAPAGSTRAEDGSDLEMAAAMAELAQAESRPYFDATQDAADRTVYYATINTSVGRANLYDALNQLLRNSHHTKPKYKPSAQLYPWVDLQPNLKLRSIYSGETFEAREFIRLDREIERQRMERLAQASLREAAVALAAIEAAMPFNCEHVVPQSWFGEQEPMRGDLHHLFACEIPCNSFRGNVPYFDFTPATEAFMQGCGRKEEGKFEPTGGKGEVARATLYFLLRYPRVIGDEARELRADRLSHLLAWHKRFPPGDYERHRNQAIFAVQGNRNPLIDHPDWASLIDFTRGFG